ncbi:methyltransferase domain-containing protein [Hyphomicrobium sp. B1]|uniref:class I SAM-dependent DNA methyltransferase n=1 Tax=Hyphomicrobium sp. B1 TaxID=3075651 RepID=UPI003C2E486B
MTSDAANIIALYERHADTWDEVRSRSLFEREWLDRFLASIPPGGSILDIGCGSGEPIAGFFIRAGYRVHGVDSSQAMIARCKARFPQSDWRIADMRTIALGQTFDGILAWDSFFHLTQDDQRRMFAIFRAHAAPGAALMFTSGTENGVAMGTFGGEPLYHASLAPEEYRALLDAQGFEVVTYVENDPTAGGHTIWLARSK